MSFRIFIRHRWLGMKNYEEKLSGIIEIQSIILFFVDFYICIAFIISCNYNNKGQIVKMIDV